MSRARPITVNGQTFWFDVRRNHEVATEEQIELLAVVEDADMDDLFDQSLTQGDVVYRLRKALGELVIPEEVLEKRAKWKEERQAQPQCRICAKEGDSTKHHFVNKWLLKELSGYAQKWCARSVNCIPVCIDCHRHLHMRNTGVHSIYPFLTETEKQFADDALSALADERPKLLLLLARGSATVYESQLIKDWINGRFDT